MNSNLGKIVLITYYTIQKLTAADGCLAGAGYMAAVCKSAAAQCHGNITSTFSTYSKNIAGSPPQHFTGRSFLSQHTNPFTSCLRHNRHSTVSQYQPKTRTSPPYRRAIFAHPNSNFTKIVRFSHI